MNFLKRTIPSERPLIIDSAMRTPLQAQCTQMGYQNESGRIACLSTFHFHCPATSISTHEGSVEKRINFLRSPGKAAEVLTDEQRLTLIGLAGSDATLAAAHSN